MTPCCTNATPRPPGWTLGVVLVCLSCGGAPEHAVEPAGASAGTEVGHEVVLTPEQIRSAGVAWEAVHASTGTDLVDVPAQLAPNEDRTARVSAPAAGRVTDVHVRVGDRVSRGAPLVTLQSAQGATARAEHAGAEADLRARRSAAQYARLAAERAERLLELKAISTQEVERARVEVAEAEAAELQADAELERSLAALRQLGVEPGTGDIVLRSPLPGLVLGREIVPGTVVEPGAPLVTVSDVGSLWLRLAVPEGAVTAIRPGTRVRFRVAALGGEAFEARVETIAAALDPTTRSLPVHAVVRNEAGRLRPAMFATAQVPRGDPRPGVSVPESALQLLDNRPVVFVAHPDGRGGARFERRGIESGARREGQVQVLTGLRDGELVVTGGAFAVKSELARSRLPG